MNVLAIGKDRLVGNQILETGNDLTTVVEDGVGDGGGVDRKEDAINEGVAGREVGRRIGLVTLFIERGVFIHDLQHLVTFRGVVPNVVIVYRDVSGVPGVCIPNREDYGSREEGTEKTVQGAIERGDQRVACDGKLVPVQGGDGVEADTADTTSYCSQVDVVRGDPGHPVEIRHSLNDVVGEPEVDEHGSKAVHEPPHPRDCPSVDDLVDLGVESTLCDNEVGGCQGGR